MAGGKIFLNQMEKSILKLIKKNYSKNKPLEYLERTKHACPMHEETLNELIRLLKVYQELEEKEFLKYLRKYLKKSKNSLNY